MANIKFSIRHPEWEQPQSIYVSFRFGRNDKLMYSTPLKVDAVFWDASRQRVKVTRYCSYADDVNGALSSLQSKLESWIMGREGSQPLDKNQMRDFLDAYFGRGKKRPDNFHDFFESYIEECDTRMNGRRGGQNVTYKTKREYARTYYYIRQYEKKNKVVLNFSDIDQQFIVSFSSFLQKLDLATNTIAHKTTTLKALMRAAVERGLTDNTKWQYYKNVTEETDAIALTEEELELIYRHPFTGRLSDIRDLFLMECWTGLRFSDVIRLREENIQGDMIVIQQQKTNSYVTIPIHPVFREIWERNGGVPIVISNQKFNGRIKEVCREAGVCGHVLKSITRGGRKLTTRYEKWQLVTSHTGRRTFATNLYKSGFPSISIMQITGHKTETAFLKYIKVSKEEHARLLAEHWRKMQEKRNI